MATYAQRAVAICDAIINAPATAEQRDRIARAFSVGMPPEATPGQIAERFVRELRGYVLDRIRQAEADAAVQAARDSVAADVAADFQEAP